MNSSLGICGRKRKAKPYTFLVFLSIVCECVFFFFLNIPIIRYDNENYDTNLLWEKML